MGQSVPGMSEGNHSGAKMVQSVGMSQNMSGLLPSKIIEEQRVEFACIVLEGTRFAVYNLLGT